MLVSVFFLAYSTAELTADLLVPPIQEWMFLLNPFLQLGLARCRVVCAGSIWLNPERLSTRFLTQLTSTQFRKTLT